MIWFNKCIGMEDIKIIYEDKDILAINKPAGLLVHPALKTHEKTLVDWLVEKYPEVKNVGDLPELRPGIVHRLDKDTSGVLLIAKNQRAFEYLKLQFQNRKIKKKYIALVHGDVKPPGGAKSGVIELPIAKSKKDFRKRSAAGKLAGKTRDAITEYKIIEKFSKYTLLDVFPKTGRTHQIRVHFREIGHPIVCDKLYGFKNAFCPSEIKQHFLHANYLEFVLPNGSLARIEADLPFDMENFLEGLRKGK